MEDREANLLRSVTETTWRFYLWVGALSCVLLWGLFAYVQQLRQGLIVTGMRDQISWGLYITNFVFFIGISHAGTLISAILRVTHTDWRRPITRMAEAITVFALCVGAPMVIIDLGRPDRMLNLFRYGRIQSPILWDVLSVSTYLVGCLLYFYLPLIPDLAILAGRTELPIWRRRLYSWLSLGWTGGASDWRLLEKAISIMAVVIIPLAVSVHTVVSWIFAMTLRPGWDSSIFGPYFVVGAIYSGAASVILSMYVLRRLLRLENYIEPLHFRNLGILLLSFCLLYLYFNINEYLTVGYKFQGMEKELLHRLFFGDAAAGFWTVQTLGVFIPLLLLLAVLTLKRNTPHVIPGVALASLLIVAGAWAKRYLIIVPTLSSPYLPSQGLPWEWTHYRPTWVEWSITAAAFAWFLLIYTLLAKLFPIVSIWETRAEPEGAKAEPVGAPVAPGWRPIPPIAMLLIGSLLFGAGSVLARETKQATKPTPTELSVEWQAMTPQEAGKIPTEESNASVPDPSRTYLNVGQLFGRLSFLAQDHSDQKPPAVIAVNVMLRDHSGAPLAFQAVQFILNSSLGTLSFGSRPTNDQGKAQLLIRDHRYGKYPVQILYEGDDAHASSRAQTIVDFGARPDPALPSEGILISPYASAAIGIPFLVFYGLMWVVFFYAFGYVVLWQMRRSRAGQTNRGPAWDNGGSYSAPK